MQYATEALDEGIGERALQKSREAVVLGTAGGDRAADQAVRLPRLLADEFDLVGNPLRRNVHLHVQHVSDAGSQRIARIFAVEKVAVQRRLAGKPGIGKPGLVDEMQMCV